MNYLHYFDAKVRPLANLYFLPQTILKGLLSLVTKLCDVKDLLAFLRILR